MSHEPDPPPGDPAATRATPRALLRHLASGADRAARITHTEHLPARAARHSHWPQEVPGKLRAALDEAGVGRPWEHQAEAVRRALRGESVIVATGTASGKSLCYLVPVLTALLTPGAAPAEPGGAPAEGPARGGPASQPARAERRSSDTGTAGSPTTHGGTPGRLTTDEGRAYGPTADAGSTDGPTADPGDTNGRTTAPEDTGGRTADPGDTDRARTGPAQAPGSRRSGRKGGTTTAPGPLGGTALYLAPTKALAADQLRAIRRLAAPLGTAVRAASYDGDTPAEARTWARSHANLLLTNPDMLHLGVLPGHRRWSSFLRRLRYVVIDESHVYRGVFGSHVAQVLRRLRRICARYGSEPAFLLASATASEPGASAQQLTGLPVSEVTEDASPRGELVFALWEPPLTELSGERGAPVRRSATAEAAELLTALVGQGARTVAFVRSRRGAELISVIAQERLAGGGGSARQVAAYRGGYLPEERRALERALHSGELLGLAATNALELGVDVSGLDAVLITGFPGTRASVWQQAGRAGRQGQGALAVMIARDDPLDTFLVHHPEALLRQPVESTVLDPANPYVLAPHLCAAAAEHPLEEADFDLFAAPSRELAGKLEARALLRRRGATWYWTRRERAADLVDIRGEGGEPVQIVEDSTGRLLGTVDASAAHSTVHQGAVHLHQGQTYVVSELRLAEHTALVTAESPPWTTSAREVTDISVLETERRLPWGGTQLCFGSVEVTSPVVAYLRRRLVTGEVLGETKLDLPPRTLRTRAVWWTVTEDQLDAARVSEEILPGALHAAEHASIGMLPLFATCDRWDIGGVSTALHPDTLLPTVFVHDGHPGGAGFAERGFHTARRWLTATRDAIAACECESGCPSCIQSPKCGNGNEPLHKRGALRLLSEILRVEEV